jgi:hypothetical protein
MYVRASSSHSFILALKCLVFLRAIFVIPFLAPPDLVTIFWSLMTVCVVLQVAGHVGRL